MSKNECHELKNIQYQTMLINSKIPKEVNDDEVNKIECDYCKEKGVKLMRGLHDSVNLHLGKKAQHPKDLDFTLKHIVWSKKQLEPGLTCELC